MWSKQPGKVSAALAGVILVGTGILKGLDRSGAELPGWLLTAAVVALVIVAAVYLIAVFREGKRNRP